MFVKSEYILQFGLGAKSDNENNRVRYVHTTLLAYSELAFLRSNTVSCCTNVDYSRVRSSIISGNAIVGSLQYILTRSTNEDLTT